MSDTSRVATPTIAQAIEACTAGDTSAFNLIYETYLTTVFQYILHMCGDYSEAEDITVETLVKAWSALPTYSGGEAAMKTWLLRIAHNHVVDALRRRRTDPIPLSVYEGDIPSESGNGPQNTAERRLMTRQVLKLMGGLPTQQRHVMVLKFIHGLETHEVSAITGQKDSAIRIAQMRALQTLRSRLLSGLEVQDAR